MEHSIDGKEFDYVGKLGEQEVLIEVKHGYEGGSLDELKDQARIYLEISKKRNAILMYRFYDEPSSANAKALLEYLKELKGIEENKSVLRIFIRGVEWVGG